MHMEQEDRQPEDFMQVLVDAREYDVPYYVRCSIDLDIRWVAPPYIRRICRFDRLRALAGVWVNFCRTMIPLCM